MRSYWAAIRRRKIAAGAGPVPGGEPLQLVPYSGVRELIERIRWGNVARLCAVVGAALLVVVGPRGCSNAGGEPAPLPPDVRVAPAAPSAPPPVATAPKPS